MEQALQNQAIFIGAADRSDNAGRKIAVVKRPGPTAKSAVEGENCADEKTLDWRFCCHTGRLSQQRGPSHTINA